VVLEGRQAIRKTFLHGRSGVAGMAQYPLTVVLEGRQAIRKTFLHGRSGVAGMAQYPLSLDGLGGVATGETGCTDL